MNTNKITKKRGRGPNIKESIGIEIILIKAEKSTISASQIREELMNRHPNSKFIPSVRGIGNYITKHSKEIESMRSDPEEKPWNLATLADYNPPSDCLAAVLELQNSVLENPGLGIFTIRKAKWAARIYQVIMSIQNYRGEKIKDIYKAVIYWAITYSQYDLIMKMGIRVNFSELDRILFKTGGDLNKLSALLDIDLHKKLFYGVSDNDLNDFFKKLH